MIQIFYLADRMQQDSVGLHLGVPLSHDVIDVGLQGHADVLSLCGVELEDVQDSSHPHFEKDSLAAAAELHDVSQLGRVQVCFRSRPEKVHASLVDTQDELGGQQADGVLDLPDGEEDGVACTRQHSHHMWRHASSLI